MNYKLSVITDSVLRLQSQTTKMHQTAISVCKWISKVICWVRHCVALQVYINIYGEGRDRSFKQLRNVGIHLGKQTVSNLPRLDTLLTFINSPVKCDLWDSRYIKANTVLKIQHIHLADGGHTSPEIALQGSWEN